MSSFWPPAPAPGALPIPGADLAGVLSLRMAADAELLKRAWVSTSAWP
jgi:hypothetical protein